MLELQKVYKLVALEAVDMFPHTPHIETIARFELR
jgi:tRNA/tmRNA/rRNA uracil-C5-methylase (TrmA/RlmC/RlmD family)